MTIYRRYNVTLQITFRVPCGVEVARQCVTGLIDRLVQNAKVSPCRRVTAVELHGADVGLQRVHWLRLLLVQHAVTDESGVTSHASTTTQILSMQRVSCL